MGNCQAIDATTLIIQHPNGKVDHLYFPVTAGDIMKTNPGHHVALLLSTTLYQNPPSPSSSSAAATAHNSLRITRIKLLRPTDTLLLGHAYRLVTSQEVMKGLCAKKQNKNHPHSVDNTRDVIKHNSGVDIDIESSQLEKVYQVSKNERSRGKTATTGTGSCNSGSRPRTWKPSLNSISEASS